MTMRVEHEDIKISVVKILAIATFAAYLILFRIG